MLLPTVALVADVAGVDELDGGGHGRRIGRVAGPPTGRPSRGPGVGRTRRGRLSSSTACRTPSSRRPRPDRRPRPHRRSRAAAGRGGRGPRRADRRGRVRRGRRRLIGPRTRVVDLAGRLLLPGFQDAHVHPIFGGIDLLECDVREHRGRDGSRSRRSGPTPRPTPTTAWIVGSGWSMADFEHGTPRREDLDAIVPDRPAFLPNRDGHSTLGQQPGPRARRDRSRHAGPGRRPDRARPGRDADRHAPRGRRRPRRAADPAAAPTTDWDEGLRAGQAYLHSLGITAWQDAIVDARDARDLPPGRRRRAG